MGLRGGWMRYAYPPYRTTVDGIAGVVDALRLSTLRWDGVAGVVDALRLSTLRWDGWWMRYAYPPYGGMDGGCAALIHPTEF